jgi:hypothetical protein
MSTLLALLLAMTPLPPAEAQFPSRAVGSDPRSQRPWVLSGELGWNGLAGVGVLLARHLTPWFSLEAGLGVSAEGGKAGMRARVNLVTDPWSPFLGAGFLYCTGVPVGDSGSGSGFQYDIGPSPYLQFVAGYEYQARGGFAFSAAVGYARLLKENLIIRSGRPTQDDLSSIHIAYGSGLVASISLGYAF